MSTLLVATSTSATREFPKSPWVVRWFPCSQKRQKPRNKRILKDHDDDEYLGLLSLHELLEERLLDEKRQTTIPFAKACQDRWEAFGGKSLMNKWLVECANATASNNEPSVQAQVLALPKNATTTTQKNLSTVIVVDDVLSAKFCESLIQQTENVGYAPIPTLREQRHLRNTSQLVQIESESLAAYLWKHLEKHFPNQQSNVPTKGLIKPLFASETANIYEKRGIIPIFRFMRYQSGQGFSIHQDPERIYSKNPCRHSTSCEHRKRGIFQSLFTVAIYLNAATEYEGGHLHFVKRQDEQVAYRSSLEQQQQQDEGEDVSATVAPAMGRAAIFRHDEWHKGGGVLEGTKYMIQCEVLYERKAN